MRLRWNHRDRRYRAAGDDGALERCCASGRKNLLVTGRELPELLGVCLRPDVFDWIVAENGGVLYQPGTKQATALGPPPSPEFVATLRRRGVEPCSTGHVVVATRQPHETVVLQTIRDLGLELQVIFNKGAVMVLPSGINKATGLAAAIAQLKIDAHCVVAVGDGENDHALLESCSLECRRERRSAAESARRLGHRWSQQRRGPAVDCPIIGK